MRLNACVVVAVVALATGGCGSDDPKESASGGSGAGIGTGGSSATGGSGGTGGDVAGPPAAPGGPTLMLMGSGIHVTWVDNADDEDSFVIERKDDTGGDFAEVTTVPFDSGQYHDAPLSAGLTYTYRIGATNAVGTSWSGEQSLLKP